MPHPLLMPKPLVALQLVGKSLLCDHRSSVVDHRLSVIDLHLSVIVGKRSSLVGKRSLFVGNSGSFSCLLVNFRCYTSHSKVFRYTTDNRLSPPTLKAS